MRSTSSSSGGGPGRTRYTEREMGSLAKTAPSPATTRSLNWCESSGKETLATSAPVSRSKAAIAPRSFSLSGSPRPWSSPEVATQIRRREPSTARPNGEPGSLPGSSKKAETSPLAERRTIFLRCTLEKKRLPWKGSWAIPSTSRSFSVRRSSSVEATSGSSRRSSRASSTRNAGSSTSDANSGSERGSR